MRKSLVVFTLLSTSLAGCMQDPASRGMAGAAAGALVADALDENMLAGAALGGLAGLLLAFALNRVLFRSRNWRAQLRMELAAQVVCLQSIAENQ